MIVYYDKAGKVLGRSWGFSRCWEGFGKPEPKDHKPHSHDPEFAMYGPYFCPGWPETEVYDAPPRVALNPQPEVTIKDAITKAFGDNQILTPNQIKDGM